MSLHPGRPACSGPFLLSDKPPVLRLIGNIKNWLSNLNSVGEPLVHIVVRSGVGVAGILDDIVNDVLQLLVSSVLKKLLLEPPLIELDKTLHALALGHHQDQLDNLLLVFAEVLQPEEEEQLEVLEDV